MRLLFCGCQETPEPVEKFVDLASIVRSVKEKLSGFDPMEITKILPLYALYLGQGEELPGTVIEARPVYAFLVEEETEPQRIGIVKTGNCHKYSLGMKQRLGLAQALMENPDVLILDEPFNGLDKGMAEKMRDLLTGEKEKGKTILLASHNEKDIEYICDRTYEIDGGRMI